MAARSPIDALKMYRLARDDKRARGLISNAASHYSMSAASEEEETK